MAGYPLHDEVNKAIFSISVFSDKVKAISHWETAKELLDGGANVDQRDNNYRTPLDYCVAIFLGDQEKESDQARQFRGNTIKGLLERGADPNLGDRRGWTSIHQAAWNDDLLFIQVCARQGKANMMTCNMDGYRPVDLAAVKGHTSTMKYLDTHCGSLLFTCRAVIQQSLGKKCCQLDTLHIPPRLKLFLNYNIPYRGFSAVLVPPAPWTPQQLRQNEVGAAELRGFIQEHASEEFQLEHAQTLGTLEDKSEDSEEKGGATCTEEKLVTLFQDMYLWEAFKDLNYEEPLARTPRYGALRQHEDNS